MPSNFPTEPWKSFFSEIDASLEEEVVLHCLGGFVMTMLYGLDRPTADVDVLPVGSNAATESLIGLAGEGSPLHKKYKVYLQIVGVAQVPLNYEDRLTEMFPKTFNHLRLFALDPYDLALSKIERNTQRDRDDVKHLAQTAPFDLKVLQERYAKELRPELGNPQRGDLTLKLWMEMIDEERKTQ
ncbi:MAG TPA: DUF6036 family nucleotidyltransferase [Pyrinomonadaceae bacterium]|nr:DUF6036 family nucleotidyltransferase [Pyrinomonadaceae bacterium]